MNQQVSHFHTLPDNLVKGPRFHLPLKSKNKDICSLILQFLVESGLVHSAFCFRHETQINSDKYLTRGRLLNLVEKGLLSEKSNKIPSKPSFPKPMAPKLNIEQMISQRVQQEMQRLGINPPMNRNMSGLSSTVSFNRQESDFKQSESEQQMVLSHEQSIDVHPPVIETPKEIKDNVPFFTKESKHESVEPAKIKKPPNRDRASSTQNRLKQSAMRGHYFRDIPDNFFKSNPRPLPRKSIKLKDQKSPNSSSTLKAPKKEISSTPTAKGKSSRPIRQISPQPGHRGHPKMPQNDTKIFNRELTFKQSEPSGEQQLFKSTRPKSLRQAQRFRTRGSINLGLTSSMEEFINSGKYFAKDHSMSFVVGDSSVYLTHVLLTDFSGKRLCLFKMLPSKTANSFIKEDIILSPLQRFVLREQFWQESPRRVFNHFLVFFTDHQFIAFDYRYSPPLREMLKQGILFAWPSSSSSNSRSSWRPSRTQIRFACYFSRRRLWCCASRHSSACVKSNRPSPSASKSTTTWYSFL